MINLNLQIRHTVVIRDRREKTSNARVATSKATAKGTINEGGLIINMTQTATAPVNVTGAKAREPTVLKTPEAIGWMHDI